MIARAFERVYSLLLYAYPPDLRRAHGADMRQCARATLATRGAGAVPRLLADLSVSVPREWMLAIGDPSLKGLLMIGIGRDVAYAVRLLWRSPGFTIAAVLTLALGIGANAAIFSLADATLLRPLKVAGPSELYTIRFSSAYPDYLAYSDNRDLFKGVVATSGGRLNAAADGRAELVDSAFVSGNYFGVLGVPPAAGRLLGPADDVPNGPIAAVLGYRWWQSRFGGDPGIVGKTIRVNNAPVTVVGIAAKGFLRVPLGFRVEGVATASVSLGAARYDSPRAKAFYDEALARVHRLPGVAAASWTSLVPTLGTRVFTSAVDGYTPKPDEEVSFYNAAIGPGYFQAAGTRLLRGRAFTDADSGSAPMVGIVNQTAVRRYWDGRDPLQGRVAAEKDQWIQLVGVVEDAKLDELDETPEPFIYLPFAQEQRGGTLGSAHLLVRTTGDAEALLGPISEQLRAIDPDAPVYDVSTFAWRVRQLVMPQRMGVMLFGAFSALELILAAIGIYGVASYVAALRTRELGIRIALGADRARIRALVLRQASVPVAAGLVTGLAIAAAGSQVAAAFLRGVPPRDPVTYALVTTGLAAIALVATWIPARRAAQLDPIRALRQD